MTNALLVIVCVLLVVVIIGQRMERESQRREVSRFIKPKVKNHSYTVGWSAAREEPWGAGDACRVCGNLIDACPGRKP
jgi:hypothetical protein